MEGEPLDDATRFLLTALVLIPLVMAGVTLLVSDRVNRYLNLYLLGWPSGSWPLLPVME